MASIVLKYQSVELGFNTEVNIIVPGAPFKAMMEKDIGKAYSVKPLRVVYLLHGAFSDGSEWVRQCGLERYVNDYNFMLVMPTVNNSLYHDLEYGPKYFKYVTEELPAFLSSLFNISTKREDTFVCGLSMGGFGAMKCALNYPEKYAGAASMSGALDMVTMGKRNKPAGMSCEGAFLTIDDIKDSNNDLMMLLEKHAKAKTDLPKLHVCVGIEDFIYDLSILFKDKCEVLNIPLDYYEEAGGHEWDFWDRNVKRILEMFSKM